MLLVKKISLILIILFSTFVENNLFSGNPQLTEDQWEQLSIHFIKGKTEMILGNTLSAEEEFKQCIKIAPQHSATAFELASLYFQIGDSKQARYFIDIAIDNDKSNPWYKLMKVDVLEQSGYYDQAISFMKEIAENNNSTLYQLDKYEDILKTYQKNIDLLKFYNYMENRFGNNEEFSLNKAIVYKETGDLKKSHKEIDKLIENFPFESRYYGMKAELLMSENKEEEAIEYYNKLIKIEPNNGMVRLALANYYKKKENFVKGFQQLSFAFSSEDVNIDTKIKILLSYYPYIENYEELRGQSFQLLEILEDLYPENPKTYSIYSDFLIKDKNYELAQEKLIKVLEFDKSHYNVWSQLLMVDYTINDLNALFEHSQEAKELFPLMPEIYLFNGISYFHRNDLDHALESFLRGKRLSLSNIGLKSEFNLYIGQIYFRLNLIDEAYSVYDEILEVDSSNVQVLNNYSYFLAVQGKNLAKAERMINIALKTDQNNFVYLDTYAWVLFKKGNIDLAKIQIEKAIKNGGDLDAEVCEHYAEISLRMGDKKTALLYFEKSNIIKPSDIIKQKIEELKNNE